MRVIAGSAKGRTLKGPPKGAPIRPVEDRVKEAIFSILFSVENFRVLDCFAGTGAIGIEGLSRGAAHATFIDASRVAVGLLTENLARCGFEDHARILQLPAERALAQLGKEHAKFDLIFVDPPYGKNLVEPALQIIADEKLFTRDGQILIEHSTRDTFAIPPTLVQSDRREYGQTAITFLAYQL